MGGGIMKKKKFKTTVIDGKVYTVVSSWEEEQEAKAQGAQFIMQAEKRPRTQGRKKRWLSGRVRHGRYDGIFDVK